MKTNQGIDVMRRRLAGTGLAAALLAAVVPLPAAAADADATPDAMILKVSNDVLEAIRVDKGIQAGDFDKVQKLVTERIMPHVDFDKMTRLTVGRPWRGASTEQRGALIEQFRILLLRTYSGALSKVSDQKVKLRPSHDANGADDAIVRTQIVPSQGDPISLDYRLEKTADGWKIYDMNILGVWLVENYKSEFNQTLSQGGVDGLIQTLTAKNAQAARKAS